MTTPASPSQEGPYRLVLGDCRVVLPARLDAYAVITDPPYGLGSKLNGGSWGNVTEWDELVDLYWLFDLAPIVAIWGGNYHALPASRGWLVWHKPDAPPSMANVELCWTNQDMNARMISHTIAATNAERVGHPTQKPLRVMKWCLQMLGVPNGATVVDPYMGSGSMGVACVQTGRNFVGAERDPGYFAIAQKRLRDAAAQPFLLDVTQ